MKKIKKPKIKPRKSVRVKINAKQEAKQRKINAAAKLAQAKKGIAEARAEFILQQVLERLKLAKSAEESQLAINWGKRNITKAALDAYLTIKNKDYQTYIIKKELVAKLFGEDWVIRKLGRYKMYDYKKYS